jgi:hypothetical protein
MERSTSKDESLISKVNKLMEDPDDLRQLIDVMSKIADEDYDTPEEIS